MMIGFRDGLAWSIREDTSHVPLEAGLASQFAAREYVFDLDQRQALASTAQAGKSSEGDQGG
jgi:hypothetical protein